MNVNKKKPLTFVNRTNYFIPDKDKTKVTIVSTHSYKSRQMKIEGYENRLYWQYRYCEDNDGQVFFYTLTYNDRHLPKMYGYNCFDYEDLRDLLTGGFRKRLLRKYGSTFKYFVGAELGDGKGKRGMCNNPHYHIVLFVVSANDKKYPYEKISEKDMTHLMRLYWQGVDQDDFPYFSYKDFNYGIVKEGEFGAKVTDYRALAYCAKYVTKDVKLVRAEQDIEKKLRLSLRNEYRYNEQVYRGFLDSYIKQQGFRDASKAISYLVPDVYKKLPDVLGAASVQPYVVAICDKYGRWPRFYEYLDSFIEPLVKARISEWRNRYSNKCRISHGVGDYALNNIPDKDNPRIQFPSKDGFKYRPLNLYFYRKLFCDVVNDEVTGNSVYVLNDDGVRYKKMQLHKRVNRLIAQSKDFLPLLLDDANLFDKILASDVNTEVSFSYSYLCRKYSSLDITLSQLLKKYAIYKLVYEHRFFSYQIDGSTGCAIFPELHPDVDYARFLVPSFYSVDRDDLRLTFFLENPPENYLPYSQHPDFLRYLGFFRVLDLCTDYFFVQNDNYAQEEAERIASVKRFHSQRQLKDFYSNFY